MPVAFGASEEVLGSHESGARHRKAYPRHQEIFQVEDGIMERRDQLEKRLVQRTTNEALFSFHWAVA